MYLETKRVTFPSRKETMKGTYVVLITVVIAAAFLGVVDVGLAKIISGAIPWITRWKRSGMWCIPIRVMSRKSRRHWKKE